MFTISGFDLSLTRGDNATFRVTLKSLDGQPITLGENDELMFSVKKNAKSTEKLISIISDENGSFSIEPQHTSGLKFGTYRYDVQLTTYDGRVYTVIPVSIFKVCEEIS